MSRSTVWVTSRIRPCTWNSPTGGYNKSPAVCRCGQEFVKVALYHIYRPFFPGFMAPKWCGKKTLLPGFLVQSAKPLIESVPSKPSTFAARSLDFFVFFFHALREHDFQQGLQELMRYSIGCTPYLRAQFCPVRLKPASNRTWKQNLRISSGHIGTKYENRNF